MAEDYFQVTTVGAAQVIMLRLPQFTDSNDFDRLNDQLLAAFDSANGGHWVLDMSHVDYMGSSALGLLVNVRQRILKSGGKLALCGLSAQLLRIFRTCCLERLFQICKTQADALKAVGG